jgi:hypothetical protein
MGHAGTTLLFLGYGAYFLYFLSWLSIENGFIFPKEKLSKKREL